MTDFVRLPPLPRHAAPPRGFVARAAALTAGLSLAGSALGLVRDQVIARLFGAGAGSDAFLVAWTVPELAATVLIEDAMALLLVPAFSAALAKGGAGALVRGTLPRLAALLAAATAALLAAAPLVVHLLAPGLADPRLAIACTRLTAATVFTFGLTGYLSAALRAHHRFLPPATVYVAYNVGIVTTLLALHGRLGVQAAAAGVAVGGALMVLVQLPSFVRALRPRASAGADRPALVTSPRPSPAGRPPGALPAARRGGSGTAGCAAGGRPTPCAGPAPADGVAVVHVPGSSPTAPSPAAEAVVDPAAADRVYVGEPSPPCARQSNAADTTAEVGSPAGDPPVPAPPDAMADGGAMVRVPADDAPASRPLPGAGRVSVGLGLVVPVVLFAVGRQTQVLVERFFAAGLPAGAISHLNYAQKVAQLPMALSLMVCTVTFPVVAHALAAGDRERARQRVERDLTLACLVVLLGTAYVIACAPQIVHTLFQRGAFDAADTAATASVMRVYALGLLGQSLVGALIRPYFSAARPTWYPVAAMAAGLGVTVAVDASAVTAWGAYGIAAGNAAGISLTAVLLLRGLATRAVPVRVPALVAAVSRYVLAGVAATGAGWCTARLLPGPAALVAAACCLTVPFAFAAAAAAVGAPVRSLPHAA
ncbi:murein biosynthesis integral membrane protein MurJ [Streptomyces sp. IBSBF 2435]|uniref:murein biosynthesis integral membrane protein MurJ n=1 Tax=Streptomyces sp. IBSBF 2435 TaxID=2903531 RepID=UPI002FDC58E9